MAFESASRLLDDSDRRERRRLIGRTTRKVELTDAGRRRLERCGELADRARVVHELLREAAEQPSGHVRVSMPVGLGVEHVAPLLPAFARPHPNVTIEFDLSPTNRDLVAERVDVAIRIGAVQGERLGVRRIGMAGMSMFAAPGYPEHRGRPQQPATIDRHRWRLGSKSQDARLVTRIAACDGRATGACRCRERDRGLRTMRTCPAYRS